MLVVWLFLIIFIGTFTQGLAGFGAGLLAMPLLVSLLGVRMAAPMFALIILVVEIAMLLRYRAAFRLQAVWRLMAGAVCGIPLGVLAISHLPEQLVMLVLGLVVLSYALYALAGLRVPPLKRRRWAFVFGFAAGLLSGAYNTGGPPYVIYGTGRGWEPAQFKSNLQGVFILSSCVVILSHLLSGNITQQVLAGAALALPAAGLGLAAGLFFDRWISPPLFRRLVLALLVVLGLTLIF